MGFIEELKYWDALIGISYLKCPAFSVPHDIGYIFIGYFNNSKTKLAGLGKFEIASFLHEVRGEINMHAMWSSAW